MIEFDDPDPSKAVANWKKHEGITFEEGMTILYDSAAATITDYESDPNEDRLVTIGMSAKARVLVVVYTHRNGKVRLISARKATLSERNDYSQ